MRHKAHAPIHLPTKESLELKRLLEWSNKFAPVWPTDQVLVQPTEERDSGVIRRKEVEEWEKIGTVKVVPIKRRNSDSVLAKGNRFAQYWFDEWMENEINDRERINQLIDEITTNMA